MPSGTPSSTTHVSEADTRRFLWAVWYSRVVWRVIANQWWCDICHATLFPGTPKVSNVLNHLDSQHQGWLGAEAEESLSALR